MKSDMWMYLCFFQSFVIVLIAFVAIRRAITINYLRNVRRINEEYRAKQENYIAKLKKHNDELIESIQHYWRTGIWVSTPTAQRHDSNDKN